MAIKKLTDRNIPTLKAKPDGAAAYYTDGYLKGLCVVVRGKRGSESRSFLFRATLNGQQLTMHLGPCAKMSLSKARIEVERCHNLIRAGQDPRQERAAQKAARKAKEDAGDSGGPPTVSKLLDLFFKKRSKRNGNTIPKAYGWLVSLGRQLSLIASVRP